MSVKKLTNESKVIIEKSPYAQILNSIIVNIKDNDAFRLYCYLYSKSENWNVAKEWTAKKCKVAQKKSKKCWSYLERCGLIKYVIYKNEKGKIKKYDVEVLNGLKFDPNEPFLNENKPSGAKTTPLVKVIHTQWGKYPPTGQSTPLDFAPLLNKDLTNKDFERKKEKSFCENSKKHEFANSMNQMASEKKYIEEHKKLEEIETTPEVKMLIHQLAVNLRKGTPR